MPTPDLTPAGVRERLADWVAANDIGTCADMAARLHAAIEHGLLAESLARIDRTGDAPDAFWAALLAHLEAPGA